MTNWVWQGNCVNSFNEDGESLISSFTDVSAFALAEESAKPYRISGDDSLQFPPEVPVDLEFSFDAGSGVLIGYDAANDIHHLFSRDPSIEEAEMPQENNNTSSQRQVDIFNVRLVRHRLLSGITACLVYDRDEPSVEFYDARQSADVFGSRGQFVSRYLVSTLLTHSPSEGLLLDTGSPEWCVSASGMREVVAHIESVLGAANLPSDAVARRTALAGQPEIPPNVGSNLIGMLIDAGQASAAQLRDHVSNVREAPLDLATEKKCECIYFDFDGETHLGELRGRNRDLCIDVRNPDAETNRAIAVRVLLDGNATKVADTESDKNIERPRG